MIVEQLYTKCLAQGAYYIEHKGEAAVIDPLRESTPYLELAEKSGAKIKYIFETHFHADFVSGHVELSEKTGAKIVYGPNAEASFAFHQATDFEEFKIGDLTIKAIHTPGHTMESTCYLLLDAEGKEKAIFTGDTLFLGDVGRPDLAVKSELSQEDLAGHLYDSIFNKIMVLPDDLLIYPGHGAGSACGKNMSDKTVDTLENQKKENYALQVKSKEEFIEKVLDGLTTPPAYFPMNVAFNKSEIKGLDDVKKTALTKLSVEEFKEKGKTALILDTRTQFDFVKGFVPNSLFIGLNGQFAPWVGEIITDIHQPIVFIAEQGKEEEVITRLARVGYDNILGFLNGGIDAWETAGEKVETLESITPQEFEKRYNNEKLSVLDVRKKGEYDTQHLVDVNFVSLSELHQNLDKVDKNQKQYIYCGGGYRSVIAASILKQNGFKQLVNVEKGFSGISKETKLPTTAFVCPNS